MPGQFQDWIRQVTTSTGTGSFTLGAAVTGFRTLANAGYANNEYLPYTAFAVDAAGNPTGDWESGIGTYLTAGPSITRNRPLASSNSNALVNFSAGNKHVIVGVTADVMIRAWGLTGCRLSLGTNWAPIADITSSSTLRLLPGPGGGQCVVPMQGSSELFGVGNAGQSGVSVTLPTAAAFGGGYTCGITNGSTAVTHSTATAVPVGCLVVGTGIPTGTYVLASTTTGFTMSRPATATNASAALTFYYSIYDVFVTPASLTTHNRDATTGMQTPTLALSRWTGNTTPSAKTIGAQGTPYLINAGGILGVYVGTIQYITTTTSRDTAAHRALYNQFNQLPRRLFSQDSAGSYAYTTGAWRIANADFNNQVEFVVGCDAGLNHGHGLDVTGRFLTSNSGGATMSSGLITDLDATPGFPNFTNIGGGGIANFEMPLSVRKTDHPGIGYHRVYVAEFGAAGGTFWGGANGGNTISGNILG